MVGIVVVYVVVVVCGVSCGGGFGGGRCNDEGGGWSGSLIEKSFQNLDNIAVGYFL